MIALTAHAMQEDRDQAVAAGADEYETKPVDLDRLLAKIEALVEPRPVGSGWRSSRSLSGRGSYRPRATPLPPTPPPSEPPADGLSRRAWVAYFRQELTAPASALAEYARELAAKAAAAGDPETAREADRIRDRSEHLRAAVQKLTAPDARTDPADANQWRDRAPRPPRRRRLRRHGLRRHRRGRRRAGRRAP